MKSPIRGIHHVTAIASDPQRNLDFYTRVLGVRFVKRTVNFDDPGTYHFYFGDKTGAPGTILTFFPWLGAFPGKQGTGMASATAYACAPGSLDFWMMRLGERAIDFDGPGERLGEQVIAFRDPDGLGVEIVASESAEQAGTQVWEGSSIAPEHALRSFHGVTLCVAGYERTAKLLTETFGYEDAGGERERFRFRSSAGATAAVVDLRCQPDQMMRGRLGSGAVHHVAFRAKNAAEQLEWREEIVSLGFNVTPVLDRQVFHVDLFPGAGRRAVRDCDRRAGLPGGRADRQAG